MTDLEAPLMSALVCTRDRGQSIVDTITSILANTHPNFELVIVDQSTNDTTEDAARPFFSDPRLRYIRSSTAGKTRALNLGVSEAGGEVVAVTDDDCTVPSDWLEKLAAIFDRNPKVAMAFCNVAAGPHDESAGFIPAYMRTDDKLVTTSRDKCSARGIGAGMAVRRAVILKLGGYDTLLGPGSRFGCCDDGDMAVRILLSGNHIYETSTITVEHFGFRTWQQGKQLSRRNFQSIGAAYSKLLKCGRWDFVIIPAYEFVCFAVWPPLWSLLRFRRPRGIMRSVSFVRGFIGGILTPLDRATMRFIDTA